MAGNLFIKWDPSDTGNRPIPGGSAFWASPSIWINSPGNFTATTGQDNYVYVQVDRVGGGSDANPAYVQTWVCNPTTAPGPSGSTLPSAGGSSGLPQASIAPNTTLPQTILNNWIPAKADATINGGHLCIVANVYDTNGDGADLTSGFVDVVNNQHHAQRNISVVAGMMGMMMKVLIWFPILEALPEGDRGPGVIRIHKLPVERVLSPVIKETLLTSPLVQLEREREAAAGEDEEEPLSPFCVKEPVERRRLRHGGELFLAGSEHRIHASETELARAGIVYGDRLVQNIEVAPVAGASPVRTIVLDLSKDDLGGVHEFDITHTNQKGQVVGGMRAVVLNAPPCL
jgi:hypothetical protein